MCLNYTCISFILFNLRLHMFRVQFCYFASAAVAHGIIVFLKKIDILFYEYHVQAHIS